MARLFLTSGQTFSTVGESSTPTEVIGTNGTETVNIAANGDAFFDGSFNRGGDIINIGGNASLYTATIVGGSRLVLTAANGASIDIPVGGVGATVNFADAEARLLRFNSTGQMLLGTQVIAASGTTAVAAGTGDPVDPVDNEFYLDAQTNMINGTGSADAFYAYLSQNPALGGVSNSLSSADRLNGGGGTDYLYAELIPEFFSGTGNTQVDIQPTIRSIEDIQFEARDLVNQSGGGDGEDDASQIIYVDAKNMRDVVEIGSENSDGDLVIENLNTLNSAGRARNTEEITITMDHTDNFNSDDDASDLHVYFDDDYLLAGQSRTTSQANYWMLDEDSPDYVNAPLLNIERDGFRLTIDGDPVSIILPFAVADAANTWEQYAAAINTRIDQMIAAGNTILEGVNAVVDYNNTDSTYNDLGQLVVIPAISLIDDQGRELVPTGFSSPAEATGAFDIYGRFDNEPSETFDNPITVNIELTKVGRNGDGGDLIIGGKNGDKGIEVFNVSVLGVGDEDPSGDVSKPSSLGTLASTGGALEEVYIVTDPEFADGDTFASLEIRDGFGDDFDEDDNPSVPGENTAPNDLRLVDAQGFKGDLLLGTESRIVNLDTLIATGGGDVTFRGVLDGNEVNQPYSYTTGGGADRVDLSIEGDAVDFAQSSVNVDTGAGSDSVRISTDMWREEVVNQAILHNIEVNTGDGNDTVRLNVGTRGNSVINTGNGNDTIYTDGNDSDSTFNDSADTAAWAFNYDRANAPTTLEDLQDLQGVQTSLRFIGGATVTVTLSGAGITSAADGGGVMALDDASAGVNGYEGRATITQLINGRTYFGDQRDVNAAIMAAINTSPLSALLTAEITENNTLVVRSRTGGEFDIDDLEVTISPATYSTSNIATAVLNEARAITQNSALTIADIYGAANPAVGTAYAGPLLLGTEADKNLWYSGLGVDNAYQVYTGDQSESETDNTINGGAGNDIIVLSTADNGWTDGAPPFTVSFYNSLLNRASNETIVLTGSSIGNDTVMNFTTAGFADRYAVDATGTANNPYDLTVATTYASIPGARAGIDFLDFTAYLTSKEDAINNSAPANSDLPTDDVAIPVTLEYDVVDNSIVLDANEVAVVRFQSTGSSNSFAGLDAAKVQTLFNTTDVLNNYGNLEVSDFVANDEYGETPAQGLDALVGTANSANGILMVENAGNLGQYKVFQIVWNGNAAADDDNAVGQTDEVLDGVVTVQLLGELDFGTTLDGLNEINLVGSDSYDALRELGFGGSGTVFG